SWPTPRCAAPRSWSRPWPTAGCTPATTRPSPACASPTYPARDHGAVPTGAGNMAVLESKHAADRPGLAQRLPFSYGWVNVVVAALAMSATLPGRTHGLGLVKLPLRTDLALDGATFDALNFWAVLLGSALCVPAGWLIDRLGARAVLTAVALALGASVLAMSRVTGPLGLLVTLTLVRGLGEGALSVVSMALVGKWFTRGLGPAMGVFTVLLAPGFIAGFAVLGLAVQDQGWRPAWAGLGLTLLVGLAPLGLLLARSSPEACG